MDLRGQNAIVTGGAVRIGLAIAHKLAFEGANICVHCHSHAGDVQGVLSELRGHGVAACAVATSFTEPVAAAQAVFERATNELGPVSILVNNAAIFEQATLAETTEDRWRRHLTINLQAPAFLCREFAERLPEGRAGSIVNIVDWRALRPPTGHLPYTVSKAGLVALTKVLAQELAPRIQVNAVAPGAILPPPGSGKGALEELAKRNPLKRTGRVSDVANAVAYLLKSEFMTGEVLHVTGGEEL
jgi:pteridine reductase